MAEENQLSEVLRMMEVVVQKVDGLASDVRTNTYAIDRLESKVGSLDIKVGSLENKVERVATDLSAVKSELSTLSGQFSDVGIMAIKDHKRVDDLEQRIGILEQKPH